MSPKSDVPLACAPAKYAEKRAKSPPEYLSTRHPHWVVVFSVNVLIKDLLVKRLSHLWPAVFARLRSGFCQKRLWSHRRHSKKLPRRPLLSNLDRGLHARGRDHHSELLQNHGPHYMTEDLEHRPVLFRDTERRGRDLGLDWR